MFEELHEIKIPASAGGGLHAVNEAWLTVKSGPGPDPKI
jgi:hypothetical protein